MRPIPAPEELTGHSVKQFCHQSLITVTGECPRGDLYGTRSARRGRPSMWLVAPWPDSAQTQQPLLAEVGSTFFSGALEDPGPEKTSFLDCRETFMKIVHLDNRIGQTNWTQLSHHQRETVLAPLSPHTEHTGLRQQWKVVSSVVLGRWRKKRDLIWALLSLSTWGSTKKSPPSSPACRL